ncbi:MAG: methylmalonyl-CoA mutase subunit beta [Bacteroidota bacterium]
MNEKLFKAFNPVSSKQWKQKIQFDLRGADYNETLVWATLEGITVKPFYHADDLKGVPTFAIAEDHEWRIADSIYCGHVPLAKKKMLDVLARGAEVLLLEIPDSTIVWKDLLDGIPLETTPIHFNFHFLDRSCLARLLAFAGKKHRFYLNLDILGHLARTGNWYHNLKTDYQIIDELWLEESVQSCLGIFAIDVALYQNAGANMVQQLAYGLAQAQNYLDHISNTLSNRKESTFSPVFKVAIGSNYFFEIAKLRALRWLWYTLAEAYGQTTPTCHIVAFPSKRNKTIYDPNVNMLRTTSECMSAVLGGADTIGNLSYDALYHKDNEFGRRIARNQLLVLKEESYLGQTAHAANGAYYIDSLTAQLAEKGLALFKQLMGSDGFLDALKKGQLQKKIAASADKEQALFDAGKIVAVGTNRYPNEKERIKGTLELYPFAKTNPRKTLLVPILEQRLAASLEQKRLEQEPETI